MKIEPPDTEEEFDQCVTKSTLDSFNNNLDLIIKKADKAGFVLETIQSILEEKINKAINRH